MIRKIAEAIEVSFEIPEAEKKIAHDAKIRFEGFLSSLKLSLKHLDIMYESFSKFENLSSQDVFDKRGLLNRYKQKVKENFNKNKTYGLRALQKLNYFVTGDISIQEIIVSFSNLMEELDRNVEEFLDKIEDYWDKDYRANALKAIEDIIDSGESLMDLVNDRIINHIEEHLLGKSWLDNVSSDAQLQLEQFLSPIMELYKERQKTLNNGGQFIAPEKEPQSLNMVQTNRMQGGDYQRPVPIGGKDYVD